MNEVIDDVFDKKQSFVLASRTKRFINNVIDSVVYVALMVLSAFALDWLNIKTDDGLDWYPLYLFCLYIFYYTFLEFFSEKR